MKQSLSLSGVILSVVLLASCGNSQLDASLTAQSASGTALAAAKTEPTEARLTVPESKIKFNNLFYGEPLRMETEKTKCRNNTTDAVCKQGFKLYHIGNVGDAHLPLLQILIVDPSTIKDTALKAYADTLVANIDGGQKSLSASDDLFGKFNNEKTLAVLKGTQGEKNGNKYYSFYTVNEKNKTQSLYYTTAKKLGNELVMLKLNAGVNQETKKESFNAYKDCGATCTAEQKAASYIEKKEGFATYKTLLDKVNTMLVSFETK
ncbi:MAG: hypothetical protein ACK4NC_00860 [Candidatus Gracilibacteria bacterium]